jgi:hemerythrin-like domain-containing protein
MNNILFMMNSDHDAIDQLIVSLNGKSEYYDLKLHELKKRFIRHFLWEEQVLFPEFENNAGANGKKIVSILKQEHQQIQNLLNENIKNQFDTPLYQRM